MSRDAELQYRSKGLSLKVHGEVSLSELRTVPVFGTVMTANTTYRLCGRQCVSEVGPTLTVTVWIGLVREEDVVSLYLVVSTSEETDTLIDVLKQGLALLMYTEV